MPRYYIDKSFTVGPVEILFLIGRLMFMYGQAKPRPGRRCRSHPRRLGLPPDEGEGGGVDGGVPPEDVDRGDNGAPQETNGGGDTVETEVYGYWDLLDKLAGIGGNRLRTSGSGGTRY